MASLAFWTNNDPKFRTIEYFQLVEKGKVALYVLTGGEVQNTYIFKNACSGMIHIMIKIIQFLC